MTADWSALERRATRQRSRWLAAAAAAEVLLAGLCVAARETGLAVIAGSGALLAAFELVTLRRHGVWGRSVTARGCRVAGRVAATIGLVLLALAVLYAIARLVVPALVFGLIGTGGSFLLAAAAYSAARFLEDAAAAVAPEPVRAICPEVRGLRRGAGRTALVVTPARVARVQATESGVSELRSIAVTDIASVEASVTRGRASLVVRGADAELAVRRLPPPQVHAVLQALGRAGDPGGD